MSETQTLLADYAKTGSEAAFHELVGRYVDLVYSAAIRMVENDSHLAQDVTQTVFADLARTARALPRGVMLGGWLHRHTCFVASKTMRGERRRKAREQIAVEMNSTEDHSADNLNAVAPHLDEAINQLGSEDRQAIMLRFFEQRDFRGVGEGLGNSEEAARKRVNRALDKLQLILKKRGIACSVAALGTVLGSQAVSAAPVGIAATVASAALVTAAATGGSTALTFITVMSMTKAKIGIAAVLALAVAVPLTLQHKNRTELRDENASLKRQLLEMEHVSAENQRLSNRIASLSPSPAAAPAASPEQTMELMKLRGEVGRLRQATSAPPARPAGPSTLSGLTADPAITKVIRQQQKAGMGAVYGSLAKQLKLTDEQTGKFADMLADDVMENIDQITAVLREGKTPEEMDQIFATREQALKEKALELLGPEGFAQYQEYNQNLISHLTSEQFSGMLTGDKAAKAEKTKQVYQIMLEEQRQTLANAGLPSDFQLVPTLNFRNIASEEMADRNLKLLDSVYERATPRIGALLSPEEAKKFGEFREIAVNGNRAALAMNRKMMSPEGK